MATSVPNSKFSSHARSISLPSSHPLLASAEGQLQRLKSSENASSSSHASACQKLDGLKNLYECLDDVLQLPFSQQQILTHQRFGNWEEGILDGSLRLLDICSNVREIYSQMKESVRELESSLRRKRNGELAKEINTYMTSKKHLNKLISKCYKELKNCNLAVVNKDFETVPLVKLIKEVHEVSLVVMKSTLSFVSPSKIGSQQRSRSLFSKLLVQHKSASFEGDSDIAAIEKIDNDLHLLNINKKSNKDRDLQMQNLVKGLQALDCSIQKLTEVLEIVFRLLLKTRVSLLNILNN
ncbi:hypothetical protein ACH5RR_035311 [Cinchona calisaya]|uniref:Uncharacterized protein n=1 Tax=Cinchona calisaya TaxID=153742 RepID=A0ABD2YGY9_9GENT